MTCEFPSSYTVPESEVQAAFARWAPRRPSPADSLPLSVRLCGAHLRRGTATMEEFVEVCRKAGVDPERALDAVS